MGDKLSWEAHVKKNMGGASSMMDSKVAKVMHEFKEKKLRSGSKKGKKVKSRKQAIAIALSEAGKSKSRK